MKKCLHCKKNVKAKALECPYCGSKNFSFSNEDTKPSTTEQSYESNNQGISVDFEKLINHALSDGELSDKEKQVIFKRAQKEGVDLDELELILEAKLKSIIGQQQKSYADQNNLTNSRENLDRLIDLALADGVLTEKERNVLFSKAKESGIDDDEFELILEGKTTNKHKKDVEKPKRDNVIKCPSCSDIIPTLSRVCPSCEFVIDARKKTSNSEKGLEELIDEIEGNLIWIKSQPNKSIFNSLAKHSYITFPIFSIILIVLGFRFTIGSPLFLLTFFYNSQHTKK